MVRKRRSPITGRDIEKSEKIGGEVKTKDQLSIEGEAKEINLPCDWKPYDVYLTNRDEVKLEAALEVVRGRGVIVYIEKPRVGRLDKIIAGLMARRRKGFDILSESTGIKVSYYTEEIERQNSKISHYLKIGVGDNNNSYTLIEVGNGRLYINYNLLPLSRVETVKCIEGQIGGYIKKEIMLLPLYSSKPIDHLSIKLRAVSIGEEVKAEIIGMINRDKIEASYTLDSGSITKSERYNMYIFYKPNQIEGGDRKRK